MELQDIPPGPAKRLAAARARLESKDAAGAVAIYEEVLASDGGHGGVLAVISGDLGSTGNLEPLVALIAPVYDPEAHGPPAGLNLLQAYLALGDPDSARHVLDRLEALRMPDLEERLWGFSNAISEMAAGGTRAEVPGAPARVAAAKGTAVSISKPIWFYGLEALASQALPAKGPGLRRIAFTQLALPGAYPDVRQAMADPEDEPALLSRAIPLWLAEAFFFSSNYAPIAALAIAADSDGQKHGAILEAEWTGENLRQLVATTAEGLDYLFTGALRGRDGVYQLTLRVWEAKGFRERKQFFAQWTPATANAELTKLRQTVSLFMELRPALSAGGTGPGQPDAPRPWIGALGASLGLFLAGKGLTILGRLGPLAPAVRSLALAAEADPTASLAWLTTASRIKTLDIKGEDLTEPALAAHPLVKQARQVLNNST